MEAKHIASIELHDYFGKEKVKSLNQTFTFYWDETTKVYEFHFETEDTKGFILVGENESLPPVLGMGVDTEILSQLLLEKYESNINQLETAKIFIISPFEYLLIDGELSNNSTVRRKAIYLSNTVTTFEFQGEFHRSTFSNATKKEIQEEWTDYLNNKLDRGKKYKRFGGIYYNQTRRNNRIAGCTPVAVASYTSILKKYGGFKKIYKNSADWHLSWSWTSRSVAVHDWIWYLHKKMKTSSDGGTYNKKTATGVYYAFYKGDGTTRDKSIHRTNIYGSGTGDGGYFNIVIKQPVTVCAAARWSEELVFGNQLGSEISLAQGGDGEKEGHCMVGHGYNKKKLLLNMGWGTSYKSQYWHRDLLKRLTFFYVKKVTDWRKPIEREIISFPDNP